MFQGIRFPGLRRIDPALQHAGVPPHTRKVIMALYQNPTFKRRASDQAAPSPHSSLLRYRAELPKPLWRNLRSFSRPSSSLALGICGRHCTPLLCPPQLNSLFHLVQFHGHYRGLVLTQDNCEHVRLHSKQRIYYSSNRDHPSLCHFCSGHDYDLSPFPLAHEVKYLGV